MPLPRRVINIDGDYIPQYWLFGWRDCLTITDPDWNEFPLSFENKEAAEHYLETGEILEDVSNYYGPPR